jgi:glutamyl-tRNA synthetase
MTVITRFAPSPTGYLHIGGARTALFNYLYAKHHGGKFLLRIEDTDQQRSTSEALDAIFDALEWLGLNYDEDAVFQSKRSDRHKEIALKLLAEGKAFLCFSTQEEIEIERNKALSNKQNFIFHSPWRDADPHTFPQDRKPVVRLKAPRIGQTIIDDQLQGRVIVDNNHLDDMVLLRGDSTATYMLAVVVDDYDMGITHIIRGDDHLTNAARQILIYQALSWDVPVMVHIPLIHAEDGSKLSKRHGAPSVQEYRRMGYLPEALCNYLLRLGWSSGDLEIIPRDQAIELFDLKGLGKAPARVNIDKLNYLNAHYLRNISDEGLLAMIKGHLENISTQSLDNITKGINSIKLRSENIYDLVKFAKIYNVDIPISHSEEALYAIIKADKTIIKDTIDSLASLNNPNKDDIQKLFKELANKHNIKLGNFMEPIRALITGMINAPSVFEVIEIIGIRNSIERLRYEAK